MGCTELGYKECEEMVCKELGYKEMEYGEKAQRHGI